MLTGVLVTVQLRAKGLASCKQNSRHDCLLLMELTILLSSGLDLEKPFSSWVVRTLRRLKRHWAPIILMDEASSVLVGTVINLYYKRSHHN